MSTTAKSKPAKKNATKLPESRAKAVLASPKKWDGEAIFKECKAQGLYPSFDSGNFIGYMDKSTGKKATTQLPIMTKVTHDAYLKAEKAEVEKAINAKAAKTPKADKPKKEKVAKAPGAGKRGRLDTAKKIHLLTKENPRRVGTAVAKSWDLYKEGMLVSDYLSKAGSGRNHLLWDVDCGFVQLI